MISMYETIMELPLFKGIGSEQVSNFLEKTKLEILNFEAGDFLARNGDRVGWLDFVITGEIRIIHHLENLDIVIEEKASHGCVIGAVNLFGLVTRHTADVIALGKLSVMRIEKEQYFNLLMTDKIYVLNLVNYLSAASQKGILTIMDIRDFSIRSRLLTLANSVAFRNSTKVTVCGDDSVLADFCGVSVEEFSLWKKNEEEARKIEVHGNKIILRP